MRRSSYRKLAFETALSPEYFDALEQKRKQLDESIHKYIASKEREFKQFEKELRQQHKVTNGPDLANVTSKARSELARDDRQAALLAAERISAVDALLATSSKREPKDVAVEAGLGARGIPSEREKDFLGLFTPRYLPALDDDEGSRHLERITSAPSSVPTMSVVDSEGRYCLLERANSDTVAQAKAKRPSELALAHRTSSSGSSADGRLASAMRSPTQRPKRKRVSLAVGDSIVAPSDSVPPGLSHNSTPSHSRSPLPEHDHPVSAKEATPDVLEHNPEPATSAHLSNGNAKSLLIEPIAAQTNVSSSVENPKQSSTRSKIDPDGDLFDLEEDSDLPPPAQDSDDFDSALDSEEDIADRVEDGSVPAEEGNGELTYDATAGLIPESADGADSAVPYLGSSAASQQPTQPGFRRPSVVHDPIYRGASYVVAEEDAVENDVYGSSYNRPTSKGSFTAGSLGESYMAQHAEDMMKLRSTRQQTSVRS